MTLTTIEMRSPIGMLRLYATADALVRLDLPEHVSGLPAARPPEGPFGEAGRAIVAQATAELEQYFAGKRKCFDVPLAPDGTQFQLQVWRALVAIPYGETRSYGEQALAIGRPSASRAVGAANGRNPIAIIIPCHRVIGASGSLTGYGGGLPTKRWLLDHEQAHVRGRQVPLMLAL